MPATDLLYHLGPLGDLAYEYDQWAKRTSTIHVTATDVRYPQPDTFGRLASSELMRSETIAALGRTDSELQTILTRLQDRQDLLHSMTTTVTHRDQEIGDRLRRVTARLGDAGVDAS
ncbi:MAG: hypothetical protein ACRCYU_19925 [Nocardioides sp.]